MRRTGPLPAALLFSFVVTHSGLPGFPLMFLPSVYFLQDHPPRQRPPMRQIFFALPYVCPREPARIADLIREHGTLRDVAAGEVLKRGGDANRLFLLEEGICAYFVAGATTGHSTIMSLLLPGTTLCASAAAATSRPVPSKPPGSGARHPTSMKGTSSRIPGSPSKSTITPSASRRQRSKA